jgi:hypothetical protein
MAKVGTVKVIMDKAGIYKVNTRAVLPHVRSIARDTAIHARAGAPFATGKLKRAIGTTPGSVNGDGAFCHVTINRRIAPHAKWVIFGTTGPIYPRKKEYLVLRFPSTPNKVAGRWPGKALYRAEYVRGQAANDFMERALNRAWDENGH